jgi:hypothetical protein
MRRAILPVLVLGIVGCVSEGGYYDGPPPSSGYYGRSSGYYGPSRGYYPQSRWDGGGNQCTFQTRRGPIAGYQPPGKNRCCIETRYGPSCQ